MTCGLLVSIGLWGTAQVAMGAEGPFASLSLKEALAQAKKEKKVVFVDFYTTWCGPCKMLDQTTWKDDKVIAFLKEKTVAIKLDAEVDTDSASKYKVTAYPTMVFIKPDGTEIDRMIGYCQPAAFLSESAGIVSGKDALTRAKEKLEAAGKNNPSARMEYAEVLQRLDKKAEALKEYLWCLDEGGKHDPMFAGPYRMFVVANIARLGRSYPAAMETLKERREAARKAVLADDEKAADQVIVLAAVNAYLDEADKNMEFYDQLKKEKPKSKALPALLDLLMHDFLQQHRYTEIVEDVDINAAIDRVFESWKENGPPSDGDFTEDQKEQMKLTHARMLASNVGRYYQALVGAKRYDQAEKLAQRLLKVQSDANTYNELAWNGFLTGKPTEANLAQARKAHELSDEKDAAIIDTLARVLNARGKKKEAVEVVKKGIDEVTDERQRAVLKACLKDIESGGDAS